MALDADTKTQARIQVQLNGGRGLTEQWLHFGIITTPGVEPGLSRPQRDVLTTNDAGDA